MKAIDDFANIKESGNRDARSLPAGGYVCSVWSVTDVPDREYLKIEFDITEGEYKTYGTEMMERYGFNPLKFVRSYKKSAVGFFKHFISTIEKSNPGYSWNWDERTLVGKKFGAVLGLEQYVKQNGDISTRLRLDREVTVDAIRKGDFAVPPLKTLPGHEPTASQPKDRSAMTDAEIEELF